mgnify:CR=1 FL=1
MVLVREDQRGQGLASKLLQTCLADLAGAGLRPLLDATEMGERVYGKIGFSGTEKIVRMKRAHSGRGAATEGAKGGKPMTPDELLVVAKRDEEILGADRRAFLALLQTRRPELAGVLRNEAGETVGYALGREGRVATQIGPIVAPTHAEAVQLVERALAAVPAEVMIDVPVRQEAFIACLKKKGFTIERGFLRMGLAGVQLSTAWPRYFAIAGPDFA